MARQRGFRRRWRAAQGPATCGACWPPSAIASRPRWPGAPPRRQSATRFAPPTVSPLPGHPGRLARRPRSASSACGRRRIRRCASPARSAARTPAASVPTAAAAAPASCCDRPLDRRASASRWSSRLRGARALRRVHGRAPGADPAGAQSRRPSAEQARPFRHRSRALLPPKITFDRAPRSAAADIFLTPLPSPVVHPESNNELTIKPVGPGGPMIIDRRGRLVWFDQLAPPLVATNFRPQRLPAARC